MLYLHGIGHFHPENVIDNRFLEELDIGTTEEWIMERVGISTRRTVLPLDYIRATKNADTRGSAEAAQYNHAQMGAAAARLAMERAGLQPQDLGMVVSGSCAPDVVCPAESASIAGELGIEVPCFDLNSACTSFGMQVALLSGMMPAFLPPYVLVVNPETLTRCTDYTDRNTAVLFGDGCAAAIVSVHAPSRAAFTACAVDSKPSDWSKASIPRLEYFTQDGRAVQGFAIRKTTDALRLLRTAYPPNGDRFRFIGHQANLGMLATVCERAEIPAGEHWHNVEAFGNTGCAGAPSVLSQHWDELHPGDHVAIALVGAGLTWVHTMLNIEGHA
jgi:3-oxoacyl-[acyl-carrier-protein] synthase III